MYVYIKWRKETNCRPGREWKMPPPPKKKQQQKKRPMVAPFTKKMGWIFTFVVAATVNTTARALPLF